MQCRRRCLTRRWNTKSSDAKLGWGVLDRNDSLQSPDGRVALLPEKQSRCSLTRRWNTKSSDAKLGWGVLDRNDSLQSPDGRVALLPEKQSRCSLLPAPG